MPRNLYTALFCLLLPVYFVRLCWKGLSNKEYFLRWSERLGFGSEIPSKDKSLIWIHAVSVGEVNASMPLLRRLITDHPHSELLVTTTTPTGSRLLIERLGNKIKHQYLLQSLNHNKEWLYQIVYYLHKIQLEFYLL